MFFKKLKTYNGFALRSFYYQIIFRKKKANQVLIDALAEREFSITETAGLLINISENYYSQKDYLNAIIYFEKLMGLVKHEKITFDKYFIKMIKCYLYLNNKEKAIELYDDLVSRQRYSKAFKKVEKIKSLLE